MSVPASPLLDGTICTACAYRCDLAREKSRCGVRRLTPAGLTIEGDETMASLDPIEAKPVFHYAPGSRVLALGGWGCSLRCGYCRNADFALARRGPGPSGTTPDEIVARAVAMGAAGVAFGFNEPLVRAERVADVLSAARERGLYTVLVTHGAATDAALRLLGPCLDVLRVDVKAASARGYHELGGARLPWGSVFRTMARAASDHGVHVEAVTTVVPGLNDSHDETRRLAQWLNRRLGPETAWHLQRFLPAHRMAHLEMTPTTTLAAIRDIAAGEGIPHTYVHNAALAGARDTWCAGCGSVLVERRLGGPVVAVTAEGCCPGCGRLAPIRVHENSATVAAISHL
jgi:pyruvate formate lyase activating enzyme